MARATSKTTRTTEQGLAIERRFTTEGTHPYDELEWELRDAIIGDPADPAFEQRGVEFPKTWTQNATNIVAQKYFRGQPGSPERETSVKQMVSRVAGRIAEAGREAGYFATRRGRRRLRGRADLDPGQPEGRLQQPGLVQRRLEAARLRAGLGLLHPQRRGRHGLDPLLEHQGGHHLQGRIGLGHQPLQDPRLDGAPLQGRDRLRPGQLHARRRLLGRRDQVRRRHSPRGQDGRARRRPPRHREVHLVQGRRGEEGRGAEGRRLRHAARLRRVRLGPVPERQQLASASPTSSCRPSPTTPTGT